MKPRTVILLALAIVLGWAVAIPFGVFRFRELQRAREENRIVHNLERLQFATMASALDVIAASDWNSWPQSLDELVPGYLSRSEFEDLVRGMVLTYVRPADEGETDKTILLFAQARDGLYECTKAGKVRRVDGK